MKKLLFILSAALVSCAPDPIENDTQQKENCGLIISIGEDNRGDYIIVKMPDYTYQQDRYKVDDYSVYKLNKQICNFDGLVKQPL